MRADAKRIAKDIARDLAARITRIARPEYTEADFLRELAQFLDEAVGVAGLTIVSRDEFSIARSRVESSTLFTIRWSLI